MYLIAALLGAAPVSIHAILLLFGLMVTVGILFGSLSMIITSFAPNFDFFNYYTQLVVSPIFFFSGVFFPLDRFPAGLQLVSQFSPLTHAVTISRAIFSNSYSPLLFLNLLAIIIPAAGAFYLAIICMKRRLIK